MNARRWRGFCTRYSPRSNRLSYSGAVHVREVRNGEQVAKLQAAILRYLADHPYAADTVRGIARYWIGSAGTPNKKSQSLAAVQSALDALVAQERIACATLTDGSQVYESVEANQPDGVALRERPRPKR
ncbi:MAG: hypothetical protein ACREPZ_06715 [Rhodanobacteraceae bacterium]